MGLVSSYRDISNPEAIHFPGSFSARTFLIVMLLMVGAAIFGVWATSQGVQAVLETLALLLLAGLVAKVWPKRITTDQFGVQKANLLGFRSVSIAWTDLAPVETGSELSLVSRMAPGLLDAKTVVVRDALGTKRVVHTPRHSDRDRFLTELKKHGATLPE